MVDRTDHMSGWESVNGIIFGQVYHTPASQMFFWIGGLNDGDHVDLSDYFEDICTAKIQLMSGACANLSRTPIAMPSGVGNVHPMTNLYFYCTSGLKIDVMVVGHKAEGGAAFE